MSRRRWGHCSSPFRLLLATCELAFGVLALVTPEALAISTSAALRRTCEGDGSLGLPVGVWRLLARVAGLDGSWRACGPARKKAGGICGGRWCGLPKGKVLVVEDFFGQRRWSSVPRWWCSAASSDARRVRRGSAASSKCSLMKAASSSERPCVLQRQSGLRGLTARQGLALPSVPRAVPRRAVQIHAVFPQTF